MVSSYCCTTEEKTADDFHWEDRKARDAVRSVRRRACTRWTNCDRVRHARCAHLHRPTQHRQCTNTRSRLDSQARAKNLNIVLVVFYVLYILIDVPSNWFVELVGTGHYCLGLVSRHRLGNRRNASRHCQEVSRPYRCTVLLRTLRGRLTWSPGPLSNVQPLT